MASYMAWRVAFSRYTTWKPRCSSSRFMARASATALLRPVTYLYSLLPTINAMRRSAPPWGAAGTVPASGSEPQTSMTRTRSTVRMRASILRA